MQVFSIASAGLQTAYRRFEQSAVRTAGVGAPDANVDLASEAVEQVSAKHAASANISVIKAADRMLGELLDIKA